MVVINPKSALSTLLIYSFVLFFQANYIYTKPFSKNLQSRYHRSLAAAAAFSHTYGPINSDDVDEDNRDYSPAMLNSATSSLDPSEDDEDNNSEIGTNNNYNIVRRQQSQPIVVQFLPPLVHAKVLENATASGQKPIANIRANILSNYHQQQNYFQRVYNRLQTPNDSSIRSQNHQIEFYLLNHQAFFAIDRRTGDIFLNQSLSNYTYILDVKAVISTNNVNNSSPLTSPSSSVVQQQFITKVPVIIDVIDINNSEPESVKNLLSCLFYDNIDTKTPICTAPFKDGDRGINAELTYLILSDDDSEGKTNNLRIDPKTGSIFRRSAEIPFLPGEYSEIILATDHGSPSLETSIKARFKVLDSNVTLKRGFNERPYFNDPSKLLSQIVLTGTEVPGDSIANLNPIDPDGDITVAHIVNGDPNSIFAIDDGTLIVAKDIDFSEKKIFNLTLMLTDGAERSYLNITVLAPRFIRKIQNKFYNTTISMSNSTIASEGAVVTDLSRYAYDTSYAKYKFYSASSYDAFVTFAIEEYNGIISLIRTINHNFNGHHQLMFSIEDNRLSANYFRTFVELNVIVDLIIPPPPPTTTTTTTSTSTTTTTTTTTPEPTPPPTTTTTTTTTTTPKPTTTSTTTTTTTTTTSTTTPRPTTTSTTTTTTTSPPFIQPVTIPPIVAVRTTQVPYYSTTIIPRESTTTQLVTVDNHRPPTYYQHQTTQPPYQPQPPYPAHIPFQPQPPFLKPIPDLPISPTLNQPPYTVQHIPYQPPLHQPPPQFPPSSPIPAIPNYEFQFRLIKAVSGIMAILFFLACSCLLCRCCFRSPKSKRYRDKNGTLLNRSSFHSQQRLHSGHHGQSPNVNGSMSRNMNSRLSLRTPGHGTSSSVHRGIHSSKYGAGDSVSLSAMNERSKQKPLLLPPSPIGTQNSLVINEVDEGLYANAFGPTHPQYLNELRRLKPDFTRMSARLPANKRQTITASSSTVNNPNKISSNHNSRGSQSKSSSALPSTPIRTSSHSNNQLKNKVVGSSHHQNHRPLPHRTGSRNAELNGSRTTNTSANVSPSLNDNNSRTVLLGSDDIRTPNHHARHRHNGINHHHQKSMHVTKDSTADYDEVASRSTVEDTTPQTSSESTSISELPSESRFKTFVKQKKNKSSSNQAINGNSNNRYGQSNQTASEDTDIEPSTSLLNEDHYDEPVPEPPIRATSNGKGGIRNHNSSGTSFNMSNGGESSQTNGGHTTTSDLVENGRLNENSSESGHDQGNDSENNDDGESDIDEGNADEDANSNEAEPINGAEPDEEGVYDTTGYL